MSDAIEQQLLALVNAADYRPLKPRAIIKQLGLEPDDARVLKRIVKRLVKQGRLVWGPKHLLLSPTNLPGTRPDGGPGPAVVSKRITGVFRRAAGGFGFVRPSTAPIGADRSVDIFIPADRTGDAASGDKVIVRLSKKQSGKFADKQAGEIVEILERDTHQFVGTYFESGGNGYVQVDGGVFQQPVCVGDPGAKNAQPDDKVVFEMVRFPSQRHDGEGVITEVLGARGAPGIDTLSIIREYELPEVFHEETLAESRAQAEQFTEAVAGRVDLTNTTIITIDPVDARDFDDAISLERIANDHWKLGVHIADVSHFVRPKTTLDREAYERATSVYLPDRVIPMLPEIISNNLASLQPERVRYTKTVFIEFTPDGAKVAADPCNSAIKSQRRFTYEEVDDYLANREAWRSKLSHDVYELLGRMHELAMILRARRLRRGALELTMQEVKIDLNKQGEVTGAHRVENTESHQIIEEFMLAANEAVAEILYRAGAAFLRRVHTAPDPRKMKALTEFVNELGIPAENLEDRFELQQLLKTVHGRPEEYAVNYAALRSLQRAVYSPAEDGHYALASDCYCHFTSPIRRYPDLTVHRLLDTVMEKRKPVNDLNLAFAMGEHCSDREQRAEAAERDLTKVKLLNYLSSRIGEELDGVVTGVEEFGIFVQGLALPAEGLIHVSSLSDDFYRYEKRSHSLIGHRAGNAYRLGDKVRVSVYRVDVDRRELDFRLVERGARAARFPRPEKPGKRKSGHKGGPKGPKGKRKRR